MDMYKLLMPSTRKGRVATSDSVFNKSENLSSKESFRILREI